MSLSQSSLCSSSFLQMGQCSPHEHFSATCFGITIAWGIAATWGGASVFTVGADVGVGVGGIGQSFLVSNKFLEADPVLGQGVPCLTGALGIFFQRVGALNWKDPSFWGLVVGHWDFSKFSCCQFVYHYWYGLCSGPCLLMFGWR